MGLLGDSLPAAGPGKPGARLEGTGRKALVADDEAEMRNVTTDVLRRRGFQVVAANNGLQALHLFETESPDVVIVDLKMPGLDGMAVLAKIRKSSPEVPVIMVTGFGDIRRAVEAMRLGAYDFLTKPFMAEDLLATVRRAIERQELREEVARLKAHIHGASLSELMGGSAVIQAVIGQVEQVATTNFTVIIGGETGTGKELVARAIHQHSARREGPLIAVDCSAIPDTLIESELFGYEKGAFTGADRRKEGYFQLAQRSTLFLDEIANLPATTQAKLLRVLQERTLQPLGATRPQPVDVRMIAASNASLEEEVNAGRFRQDLYYRLSEFVIALPALRERTEDIPHLARRFLDEACLELGRSSRTLSEDALRLLMDHPWPGNVRQLRNVLREAVLTGPILIRPEHLRIGTSASPRGEPIKASADPAALRPLRDVAAAAAVEAEREAILRALDVAQGNKSEAARLLDTDYKTLRRKMRRFGLLDTSDPA